MLKENLSVRIDYLDIFKSFGIILMIMGHIGFGRKFDFFIHAFHMPMFFWISGFLFKSRTKEELSFGKFVLKKIKSLLIPYFVFGSAHFGLYVFYCIVKNIELSFDALMHLFTVNTEGIYICGGIWFLTALFFADVIFFLIDRYIKNNILKALIVGAVAIFGNVAEMVLPATLPFALAASFVGLGFYYLGYIFNKCQDNKNIHLIMNLSWASNIVWGGVTTVLIFLNGYINMRVGLYSIIPLFWINALLSIIVSLNFVKLTYPYIQDMFIGKWFRGIGIDSIVYVCLNQLIIMVVVKCVNIIKLPIAVQKLGALTAVLAILFIISKMIAHTKLKVLIGK